MSETRSIRETAEAAWQSMQNHGIAATPRNYRTWFSYCDASKPALRARLDQLLGARLPVTDSELDTLHSTHFSDPADLAAVRDGASDLHDIAAEMIDRVSSDRLVVAAYASALKRWASNARSQSTEEMTRVAEGLGTAGSLTSDRLAALEQLFAASVVRIGDLRKRLAKAEQEAMTDALTGLANRRSFDVALECASREAGERGTDLTVLMIDIDHFKQFNDTHGHPLGDSVLRLIGHVLVQHIKGRDTAARVGGEEFTVILAGAPLEAGVTVAEQIRQILERHPIVNRSTGQRLGVVTCSIGVAQYYPGEPTQALLTRADRAMYEAKRGGRNRVMALPRTEPA